MKSNPPHSLGVFTVSLGWVYSSPPSCSCPPACLAKAGAFPSPPTPLMSAVAVSRESLEPPCPHVQSRELRAVPRSERPHWLQKLLSDDPRAAKSSSLTRQELESRDCSMYKLLLQMKRVFHTAEAPTQAQSRSRTCSTSACRADHICAVFHKEHISIHMCIHMSPLHWKYLYPCSRLFPGFATPWMLICT